MKIDIITLFPDMFNGPFNTSMIKKAKDAGAVNIHIHDLRNWAKDKRKTVDDRPYGGGKGMVIRVDIVYDALKDLKAKAIKNKNELIVLLSPQGKVFNQKKAIKYSRLDRLILIAGHYEGFDERISQHLVDEELSIGDYILTGGEIPAMVVVDSTIRLLPGVLDKEATSYESFSQFTNTQQLSHLLDFPSYTRPEKFLGWDVPKILLSGNHKDIDKWRKNMSYKKTKKNRPDLITV